MEPGQYYHVYNRANAFEKLFHRHENYLFFLEKCEKYIPEVATLYAFALIPNHFHFLIRVHSAESIGCAEIKECSLRVSQVLSNLFNSYTKSFNRYYRRRGTLFSRHFKNKEIDTLNYRMNCVLYMHHNGVHHRLCEEFEEWPYTSHWQIIERQDKPETVEVLSWFGGIEKYINACKNFNTSQMTSII